MTFIYNSEYVIPVSYFNDTVTYTSDIITKKQFEETKISELRDYDTKKKLNKTQQKALKIYLDYINLLSFLEDDVLIHTTLRKVLEYQQDQKFSRVIDYILERL